MTTPRIIVGGKLMRPEPWVGMVYLPDWPPRWARLRNPRGWMWCDDCGRNFKLWVTSDRWWNLLPRRHRRKTLCTRCYRKRVPQ